MNEQAKGTPLPPQTDDVSVQLENQFSVSKKLRSIAEELERQLSVVLRSVGKTAQCGVAEGKAEAERVILAEKILSGVRYDELTYQILSAISERLQLPHP